MCAPCAGQVQSWRKPRKPLANTVKRCSLLRTVNLNSEIAFGFHMYVLNLEKQTFDPRHVDEMDSVGVRKMADKIGSGKISVTAAAECVDAFQHDGSNKVRVWKHWWA